MYDLDFTTGAESDLDRLDTALRRRVLRRLKWLGENAERAKHERLNKPLSNLFKFRIGDYRVLYDLLEHDKTILIHKIGHRREVYRER